MKHFFVLVTLISIMLYLTTNAQDQSTRFEKQHNSKFLKSNLENTEGTLLMSFESNNLEIISSSVRTLRQLEQVFPDYSFSSLIDPLIKFIKDENMDKQVRILSALSLNDLHSDMGDEAIFEVSKSSSDQSVKDVCEALSIEENLKNKMANKTFH